MDVIKNKIFFLAALTILGGAATAFLALQDMTGGSAGTYAFWTAFLITSATSCLMLHENDRLESAKLISENQILHIRAAEIMGGEERTQYGSGGVEAFVSCFGILLNSKVIKFNQDRIQLRTVEIEQDYIVLAYGSKRRNRSIRLLHAEMDEEEIKRIVEAFRYETGIVPKVIKEEEEKR